MPVPIDPADLTSASGRERALDRLGAWFVEAVLSAADDAARQERMREAVVAFYDIRESADQPRGMYAGHFFLVDAVGLENSDRPVPWFVLAERVDRPTLDHLMQLFNAAEHAAR